MNSLFRPFPLPLTGKQWFYIVVLQGVVAGFVDGGLNFMIAYFMYHDSSHPVKMWVFTNTIAGDLGVTPLIQCAASMLITSTLVHTDLHHKAVKPLPFCYPHVEHLPDPRGVVEEIEEVLPGSDHHHNSNNDQEGTVVGSDSGSGTPEKPGKKLIGYQGKKGGFKYRFWMLMRYTFEGTEKNMLLAKCGFINWLGRVIWTLGQGAMIGIVFGLPLWCLAVTILGPIYGHRDMGHKWAPQAIKLVYATILGWITNPVIAILALGSQAEHHLLMVEVDVEEGQQQPTDQEVSNNVPTIPEDVEVTSNGPLVSPPHGTTPSGTSIRAPAIIASSPNRSRANSAASRMSTPSYRGRPPLTANVSFLAPLSTSGTPGSVPISSHSGRPRNLSDATNGSTYDRATRPRGATISSQTSSMRSYSYVLGGTGGRAQRSRSNTTQSATIPSFSFSGPPTSEVGGGGGDTVNRPASSAPLVPPGNLGDVFGRRDSAPMAHSASDGGRIRGLRRRTEGEAENEKRGN